MGGNDLQVDMNVDNYTVSELLLILDLDDPNPDYITEKSDFYIAKFKNENNREMVDFFQDVQNTLLEYATELEDENTDEPAETSESKKQSNNWWKNQILTQDDPTQNIKITDRKQKIDIFNNNHVPMKQQQLGVVNATSVPVAQDTLNPTLKNITNRFINLDSQYRQLAHATETSTDYTLDLSETLTDVLSLRLYSIQIPYTWYAIDLNYGNTCFWISFMDTFNNVESIVTISIESGNYSSTTFTSVLNAAIATAGITFSDPSFNPVSFNSANGKITLNLIGGIYIVGTITYIIDIKSIVTFFRYTSDLRCIAACVQKTVLNQSLGWIMGFRTPDIIVNPTGNTAPAVLDLYGPKYLILVIDDFNQNHLNNGLIGITEPSTNIKLPLYYSPDLPQICIDANPNTSILSDNTYTPTPQILPTAPRLLTQTQIYTINEILKNNEKTTSYRLNSPTPMDTFAIIPIKRSNNAITGDTYVEFGGSLQDNKRTYFGPVNIERLRVKLLDDKGNILNLNGCDWSITLISENLYQY